MRGFLKPSFRFAIFIASAVIVTAAMPRTVAAHDLLGLLSEYETADDQTRAALDEIEALIEMAQKKAMAAEESSLGYGGEAEAVVMRLLAWEVDQPVTVCFFDGSDSAWKIVEQVATEWLDGTSLKFAFQGRCDLTRPSDIRVSFEGIGYYSMIGKAAKKVSPSRQTLNLQGMGALTSFSDFQKGVVRHEFGHAVSFHHEHQSPASGCEGEFDMEYLYRSLPWPKDKVDFNIRRLNVTSTKEILVTAYDRLSVMHYALDRRAFKNPDTAVCYLKSPNNQISKTDKEAMQEIYPLSDADTMMSPATSSEEQGVLGDLVDIRNKIDSILNGQ